MNQNEQMRELCRRLYVELYHCDKQMTSTLDDEGEQLWKTGKTVSDVLADAKQALAAEPAPNIEVCDSAQTDKPAPLVRLSDEEIQCLYYEAHGKAVCEIDYRNAFNKAFANAVQDALIAKNGGGVQIHPDRARKQGPVLNFGGGQAPRQIPTPDPSKAAKPAPLVRLDDDEKFDLITANYFMDKHFAQVSDLIDRAMDAMIAKNGGK